MNQKGFSLLEMLIAMGIFGIIMGVATSTYITFLNHLPRERKIASVNSDAKIAMLLMEKDIKTAGFGLPPELRIASDDNCTVGDTSFCVANSDRIFIADGWEMIKDFTNNGDEDGTITTAKYVTLSTVGENGGYFTTLSVDTTAGATLVPVTQMNINSGDEEANAHTPDDDFKANRALILYNSALSTLEGHRTTTGSNMTLLGADALNTAIPVSGTQVVPAIAYYIAVVDGNPWLFRNNNKVLKGVSALAFQYGYDDNGNQYIEGNVIPSEWKDSIPGGFTAERLKAVRISMTVDVTVKDKTYSYNFQTITDMRN
ncbi:MAG: PilW family protein [Nitrospinota bacterium]